MIDGISWTGYRFNRVHDMGRSMTIGCIRRLLLVFCLLFWATVVWMLWPRAASAQITGLERWHSEPGYDVRPHCDNHGGSVSLCLTQINKAIESRAPFRIVQDCESSCVLRLRYVACIAPGVTFGFHEVRTVSPAYGYSGGKFSVVGQMSFLRNLPPCVLRLVQAERLMASPIITSVQGTTIQAACHIPTC
jgi:hypothetical protein